jgi:hypothetical protein
MLPLPPWRGKVGMGGGAGHLCADVHPPPPFPVEGEGARQCKAKAFVLNRMGGCITGCVVMARSTQDDLRPTRLEIFEDDERFRPHPLRLRLTGGADVVDGAKKL